MVDVKTEFVKLKDSGLNITCWTKQPNNNLYIYFRRWIFLYVIFNAGILFFSSIMSYCCADKSCFTKLCFFFNVCQIVVQKKSYIVIAICFYSIQVIQHTSLALRTSDTTIVVYQIGIRDKCLWLFSFYLFIFY